MSNLKIGDKVKVVDKDHYLFGKEVTVINPEGREDYEDFENYITVKDSANYGFILLNGTYEKIEDAEDFSYKYKPTDKVILLQNTKGMQKPFYHVIEADEYSVTLFDDYGTKHHLPLDRVRPYDPSDLIDIVGNLAHRLTQHEKKIAKIYDGFYSSYKKFFS